MFEKEGKSHPGSRLEVVEFRALDGSLFEIIATMMPQGPTFFLRPLAEANKDGILYLDKERAAWLVDQLQRFLRDDELKV
jgi:hypothetical protein